MSDTDPKLLWKAALAANDGDEAAAAAASGALANIDGDQIVLQGVMEEAREEEEEEEEGVEVEVEVEEASSSVRNDYKVIDDMMEEVGKANITTYVYRPPRGETLFISPLLEDFWGEKLIRCGACMTPAERRWIEDATRSIGDPRSSPSKAKAFVQTFSDTTIPVWQRLSASYKCFERLCSCLQSHILNNHAEDFRRRFVFRFDSEAERRERQWQRLIDLHNRRRERAFASCRRLLGQRCRMCECPCHQRDRLLDLHAMQDACCKGHRSLPSWGEEASC